MEFEEDPPRRRPEEGYAVSVDGYEGPLDHLIEMARTRKVNLLRLPLLDLIEQLVDAVEAGHATVPVSERATWLVQAATIVQTWSRLRFAETERDREDAERTAAAMRRDILGRAFAKALAGWLGDRPQIGIDCFARGMPEDLDALAEPAQPDRIAFLWALARLLDADLPKAEQERLYRPPPPPPHGIAEARARLAAWLRGDAAAHPTDLWSLRPPREKGDDEDRIRGSASSTFAAGLELCRQDMLDLTQAAPFGPIMARRPDRTGADAA